MNASNHRARRRRPNRRANGGRMYIIRRVLLLVILVLLVAILAILAFGCPFGALGDPNASPRPGIFSGNQSATPSPTPTASPTPTPEPTPFFHTPAAGASTQPSAFGFKRELEVDGARTDSYQSPDEISFGPGEEYTALEGIITFRGNNYRDNAAYGTADISAKTITLEWSADSGSMPKGDSGDGSWTGSGWVGQPLIVRWPEETKRIMNLYDSAKNKPNLVEVIYATMDGRVHFLDLETGEQTRDRLVVDMPFKGAGALDPRGYPLLYLGSGEGYTGDDKRDTRVTIYSLINFDRLHEFGRRDPFAIRSWHAYDSSPLVHAKSDTLFYPGENGVLYRTKLNTVYDPAAGTISMNPTQLVKFRYDADRYADPVYYRGYEDSAAVWGEYMYLTDNGGIMQCINLNTMDIVWTQDTWDDTNGTPVLEVVEEDATAYLYVGTSLRIKKNSNDTGEVAFFKINAATGEIVWQDERTVATVSGTSGGVQATAVLGKESIADLVIIPYSRYPSDRSSHGAVVALDKKTGEERWRYDTNGYSWGSPIALYDAAGNAYIVIGTTRSTMYLLDGKTGILLDAYEFEETNNFEASPAAFGNMVVVGSRSNKIYGFRVN